MCGDLTSGKAEGNALQNGLFLACLVGLRRGLSTRWMRVGTDDEAEPYVNDLIRFARSGVWGPSGGRDYRAEGRKLQRPCLGVYGAADTVLAPYHDGTRWLEASQLQIPCFGRSNRGTLASRRRLGTPTWPATQRAERCGSLSRAGYAERLGPTRVVKVTSATVSPAWFMSVTGTMKVWDSLVSGIGHSATPVIVPRAFLM